jgi:hypothetical protein
MSATSDPCCPPYRIARTIGTLDPLSGGPRDDDPACMVTGRLCGERGTLSGPRPNSASGN